MNFLPEKQGIRFAPHWKEIKAGTWPSSQKVAITKEKNNTFQMEVEYLVQRKMWIFLIREVRDEKQQKRKELEEEEEKCHWSA